MGGARGVFQYRQNIHVLEDPVAYRKEVVRYLDLVQTTYAGRTLITHINQRGRHLLIIPYVPANEPEAGPVNAYPHADSYEASFPSGWPLMNTVNLPGVGDIQLPTVGTGAGSAVTLKYHPATYRQLIANQRRMNPGDGPGEVLFHEMVHVLQMMTGTRNTAAVPEEPGMGSFEEFCSILAANMYRSERGFKQLRKNHDWHKPLESNLADSQAYAAFFSTQIEKWINLQMAFCLDLAASPAKFNPLKFVAAGMGLSVRTLMQLP